MDFVDDIKHGAVFIYPTDTIYGLGCDATNLESVGLIKKMKYRDRDKPMSVIAPSVEWIKEHLVVEEAIIEKYFPGPYTLILKKKNPDFMKHISSNDSIGVRIPDCEFTELVEKAGVPFITTSVNFVGKPFAVKISDINHDILDAVDIVIIDGKEIKR